MTVLRVGAGSHARSEEADRSPLLGWAAEAEGGWYTHNGREVWLLFWLEEGQAHALTLGENEGELHGALGVEAREMPSGCRE